MVEPMMATIITGLVVTTISGIILAITKRKWQKNDKKDKKDDDTQIAIKDVQKSVWRLNKTVLIMAKIIDDQNVKVHSELSSSLEDIASELLKESE